MDELERNVAAATTRASRWASVAVVQQSSEAADTLAESRAKWQKIYLLFSARGESEQDEVFAAVNYYFLRNGASPSGKYAKSIRTAGGVEVSAGEVVKVTGRLAGEIRQFLRGRLEDSYLFLKNNSAIADDASLATAAENAGVPKRQCWLLADWLGRDCAFFVGDEAEVYNRLRTSKIAAAQAKRAAAQIDVDPVLANAPETKFSAQSRHRSNEMQANNDLF